MTLAIYVSDSLEPLADQLAGQLTRPLADPMQPELVAVPSVGLQRWLRLRLASTLGALDGAGDGVAANIEMPFPGVLRSRLLAGDTDPESDPWAIRPMAWTLHRILVDRVGDPQLASVARLPEGATWYGRARRIADLFDRYAVRRPAMLRSWLDSRPVGPAGSALAAQNRWQPHLFGLLREEIGSPSPAERLTDLLGGVADGRVSVDLPPRFGFFGLSTLPGGAAFGELLVAFGAHHDVSLYLLDPAPRTTRRLIDEGFGSGAPFRVEDRSTARVRQPLLRSWGRPAREAQLALRRYGLPAPELVGPASPTGTDSRGSAGPAPPHHDERAGPSEHLLGRLQRHLRSDSAPRPEPVGGADESIRIHSCAGPLRQLEVLRDAVLAGLRDDPTLDEADIVIVCPDLATFAPLVPGVFGPSAEVVGVAWDGPPRLRYAVSDRGLRQEDTVGSALIALAQLVGSRYPASGLLDFLGVTPVRAAFGFDDDALERITEWVENTAVRWGLNEGNRIHNDLPDLPTNTWRFGLQQLLVGMAIDDDEPMMGPAQTPAWGVEGAGVDTLNRLIAVIRRLEAIEAEWLQPATPAEWNRRLSGAVGQLFDVPVHERWQLERARTAVAGVVDDALLGGGSQTPVTIHEIRQILTEVLTERAARPRFLDGGITITSLRPLRWVPHRMVCILGLDDAAMVSMPPSGDDLVAAQPELGDPDPRADQRQALLELLLSAGDRLVITRTGSDVRTNATVPRGVAVSELLGELDELVAAADRRAMRDLVEVDHTRHAHHPANFASERPVSFDPRALRAARTSVQAATSVEEQPQALGPPSGIEFTRDDLVELLLHGPKFFLRRRLDATVGTASEGPSDRLPVGGDHLQDWSTLSAFIEVVGDGLTIDHLGSVLRARGLYPPAGAGEAKMSDLSDLATRMHQVVQDVAGGGPGEPVPLAVELDGAKITGQIAHTVPRSATGPIHLSASKYDKRLRIRLWVDLCLLTLQRPETAWTALAVARTKSTRKGVTVEWHRMTVRGRDGTDRARTADTVITALLRLARTGVCEPLPIFAKVTSRNGYPSGWSNAINGMATDPYVLLTYGRLSEEALLGIPAHAGDPGDPDQPSRFLRLEGALDGLFEQSVHDEKDLG